MRVLLSTQKIAGDLSFRNNRVRNSHGCFIRRYGPGYLGYKMSTQLQPTDSMFRRLWGYALERFPPLAYTVLVVLFAGSAFGLAAHLGDIRVSLETEIQAAVVVLLVFLHLRIMDEHKDADGDLVAYPQRLLSRGVVTLPLLAKVGYLAVVIEMVLAFTISLHAFYAWLACLVFTLLMKVEFGVGEWLNRHLVVYAVTHNPIVALLGVFLWVAADAPWDPLIGLYLLGVSLGSLAFELGRKIRLPTEEIAGVESYSSVLGVNTANRILRRVRVLASACFGIMAWEMGSNILVVTIFVAAVFVSSAIVFGHLNAKKTEALSTVALLMDFIFVWILVW